MTTKSILLTNEQINWLHEHLEVAKSVPFEHYFKTIAAGICSALKNGEDNE